MQKRRSLQSYLTGTLAVTLTLGALGCAGVTGPASRTSDFVEIPNPGLTMSPNAPETVWVPRSYVEKGVPRGKELVKEGYDALTGKKAATPVATRVAIPVTPVATPPPPMLVDTAGKPAGLIPHFGLVVAVDGERVYFNLGKEDGIAPGQALKVYRGGTIVKGLGLAPGETVGTMQVLGLVGSKGAYGVMQGGEPARASDLIGSE